MPEETPTVEESQHLHMTEAEAWEFIAQQFELYEVSGEQNKYTVTGLCYAIEGLHFDGDIDGPTRIVMEDRLWDDVHESRGNPTIIDGIVFTRNYLWDTRHDYAGQRAMLAQLYAEACAAGDMPLISEDCEGEHGGGSWSGVCEKCGYPEKEK